MLDARLTELGASALAGIAAAGSPEDLERVRVDVLGRKGALAQISKEMGKVAPEQRGAAGKLLNSVKQEIEAALEAMFVSMGFTVLDGPEVESEYNNFDALNIPADHPARDAQDTFWLTDGNLLRTHTSPVQIRGMEKLRPPFRMIAPGRAFRNESVDASHDHTFYQLEGMVVDREVSVANLIYFMKAMLAAIFHREVAVRLRPGFFPFVEPGFELDIQCLICGGSGCPVCKHSGWVELLPCGLVNPAVLRMSKIDPEQWNGFAFGLGLTRLVMMRYGIDDIRLLQSGDLRFLQQF